MRTLADVVLNQKPLAMAANVGVRQACQAMAERQVCGVLVVNPDRRHVGIFTARGAVAHACKRA